MNETEFSRARSESADLGSPFELTMTEEIDGTEETPTAVIEIEVTYGFRQALAMALTEMSRVDTTSAAGTLYMARKILTELSEAVQEAT